MPILLHIDMSVRDEDSVSREITASFAEEWQRTNPDGWHIYRDLAVEPVPHFPGIPVITGRPARGRIPGFDTDCATIASFIEEVRWADAVLLGVPMYDSSISSRLKAWLSRVVIPAHVVEQSVGGGLLSNKRVVVVSAHGSACPAGDTIDGVAFQEPYVRTVFSSIGIDCDLRFVRAHPGNDYRVLTTAA